MEDDLLRRTGYSKGYATYPMLFIGVKCIIFIVVITLLVVLFGPLLHSWTLQYIYDMHVLNKGSPRSPQLIDIPSLALSPVAPVLFNLSEPAK